MKVKIKIWPKWARPIALYIASIRWLPRRVRVWFACRSIPPFAVAMGSLLVNLFANAPVDKIKAGESCSWDMTPEQQAGSLKAVESYVKNVNN